MKMTKRILAIVLAMMMSLGMFAVGAGAISNSLLLEVKYNLVEWFGYHKISVLRDDKCVCIRLFNASHFKSGCSQATLTAAIDDMMRAELAEWPISAKVSVSQWPFSTVVNGNTYYQTEYHEAFHSAEEFAGGSYTQSGYETYLTMMRKLVAKANAICAQQLSSMGMSLWTSYKAAFADYINAYTSTVILPGFADFSDIPGQGAGEAADTCLNRLAQAMRGERQAFMNQNGLNPADWPLFTGDPTEPSPAPEGPPDEPAPAKKYIRLWGKQTTWESNFLNWLLCIFTFGWLWMK